MSAMLDLELLELRENVGSFQNPTSCCSHLSSQTLRSASFCPNKESVREAKERSWRFLDHFAKTRGR